MRNAIVRNHLKTFLQRKCYKKTIARSLLRGLVFPMFWTCLSERTGRHITNSNKFTVRAFNFKHIKGVTTMLSVVRARFFSLLCKMWTTVFQFPKGQQNEPGLAVKKTKVLLSYKIYNHYFRKSPFKNCISILLHYLDWYQKKIDQGNRKYSWKIWMMHGAWWNMNELQFFA